MPQIAVLDKHTIDQIAAGEVVERPASVVKELVENAIDAGSTAVTVEIKQGGIAFIRITDNGCGIPKEQIATAFLRHATSKITSVQDLLSIHSLGFRGEALSSISAVAQVELISKTKECLTGSRYVIEGGTEKTLEEIGAPEGTTILVRNLFFNVPARAKFLKTAATEANYITSYMEQLALSHPSVSFKYIVNGQVRFQTTGRGELKEIIYQIYGRDIAAELLPVSYRDDTLSIQGFIGKPIISRGNRNFENYYVNGRYIKDKIITKGIEEGYRTFMMQHQYPFTCLFFEMPGTEVDINVHPAKREVRFSSQEKIYFQTKEAVLSTLHHAVLVFNGDDNEKKSHAAQTVPRKEALPEPFETRRREQSLRPAPATVRPVTRPLPVQPVDKTEEATKSPVSATRPLQTTAESLPFSGTQEETSPYGCHTAETATVSPAFKATPGTPEKNTAAPLPSIRPVRLSADRQEIHKTSVEAAVPVPSKPEKGIPAAVPKSGSITEQNAKDMQQEKPEQLSLFSKDSAFPLADEKRYTIIGQLFDTYWLFEMDNALFIMDQHAAHEKVMFERLMKEHANRAVTSQMVSPPTILHPSMQEMELLKEYTDVFAEYGFALESFGSDAIAVRSVPHNLYGIEARPLFEELLADCADGIGKRESRELIGHRIATMACKAAVKGNNRMSLPEVRELLKELLTLDNPYQCPHGRPTIIRMTRAEIEKKFRRIV